MTTRAPRIPAVLLLTLLLAAPAAGFDYFCPADTDDDGVSDDPNVVCKHVAGSDGLIQLPGRDELYVFGFSDVTGPPSQAQNIQGILRANQPAPTIELREGQVLHLSLSIAGFALRPDIPDPHTVHYHGFPNASAVYDGVPDLSIAPVDGATLHYYYENVHPGTYIWHCHVEATEHLQMGMIGQLFVKPAQDGTPFVDPHNGKTYTQFAYNDGDGTTGYDATEAIQLTDFDADFHDASLGVQPLPFANMSHHYYLMNGRAYPDTVSPGPLVNSEGNPSQPLSALLEVTQGDRILVRFSNLSVTLFHTIASLGIPMHVVAEDARLLRGPSGQDLSYTANSITIGGGQTVDVLLDTDGVAPGTYYLFSRNLFTLNNNEERRGGMMTEIRVVAAP
jgi:FtsP/CotA-like multicopper oxidase with cupredoxin domain